jgi:chemotaxis protein CheD
MGTIVLGVGDLAATNKQGECIKTLALGSCVAVVIMDPKTRCIAMDHIALPDSSISPERAHIKPGHFADTGIPALLEETKKYGSLAQGEDLIVKLVGGASVMDPNNAFNIGKRNVLSIKRVLWNYGLGALVEDVGGQMSRSVLIDVDAGRVVVSSPGRESWEI